jgi:hypothetical protein
VKKDSTEEQAADEDHDQAMAEIELKRGSVGKIFSTSKPKVAKRILHIVLSDFRVRIGTTPPYAVPVLLCWAELNHLS